MLNDCSEICLKRWLKFKSRLDQDQNQRNQEI